MVQTQVLNRRWDQLAFGIPQIHHHHRWFPVHPLDHHEFTCSIIQKIYISMFFFYNFNIFICFVFWEKNILKNILATCPTCVSIAIIDTHIISYWIFFSLRVYPPNWVLLPLAVSVSKAVTHRGCVRERWIEKCKKAACTYRVAQKDLKAVELLARILTMMVDQKELVHMLEELIFLFLHPFFLFSL